MTPRPLNYVAKPLQAVSDPAALFGVECRSSVKNMMKKPLMTVRTESTWGPPEKSSHATARNHATALSAIFTIAAPTRGGHARTERTETRRPSYTDS
jgi:hypothetical protein